MKHIESIQPEYAAGELERSVREEGDATASAALSRLLHDWTGCAIPPTADLPESEVEELVPLCLSILRRHWTTPLTALGDGTTPMSLADLLRRLILGRVDGNEALGIPPANADIPTAVAALTKRHIDDGLTLTLTDGTDGSTPTTTSLPDGLSLAQLFCSGLADTITELQDSNKGWVLTRTITNSVFPNITALRLGCKSSTTGIVSGLANLEELGLPELDGDVVGFVINGTNKVKSLDLSKMKRWQPIRSNQALVQSTEIEELDCGVTADIGTYDYHNRIITGCSTIKRLILRNYPGSSYGSLFSGCPNLEYVYAPEVINISRIGYDGNNISNLQNLHTFIAGGFQQLYYNGESPETQYGSFKDCPNLIYLQAAKEINQSTNIQAWNPSAIWNDSDKVQAFLSNFKTYIAQRLTDHGSGLTLTLSQAVRDAIQQDPDIVNIITSKGWTISPAPSV